MPHEFLPHTGDIAVRVWAESLPALFESAARAFTDAFTDGTCARPVEARIVTVEAAELDILLHDFLAELLYLFDAHRWVVESAVAWLTAQEGVWRLEAHLRGEPFVEERHAVKVLVKAVTYHGLTVTRDEDGWTAEVVFDV